MAANNETIVLNGSKDAIEAISKKIEEYATNPIHVTERRNLDGDMASWIVIATLASQALPHILNFIKDYVTGNKVKRIKIGDFEVENPTSEMIDQIMRNRSETNQTS